MADYIDRQSVVEYIEKLKSQAKSINGKIFFNVMIDSINSLQAADVREDVHGKWEIVTGSNGKEYMVCTNCRVTQDLTALFAYCPNCGARMDRGDLL